MIFLLVYANFVCPLAFFVFILSVIYIDNISFYLKLQLGTLALLLNNPVASPRFYTFTIFIVIYTLFLMKREKTGWFLLFYLAIGLLLSFYMSDLRYLVSINDISKVNLEIDMSSFVDTIHFDAFEVLMMSVKYVEHKGIMMGENILGAMLFFIPRVFWLSKPEPSGVILILAGMNPKQLEDNTFTNISCPFVAESFLAFGYIGVIIIPCLLAYIISNLDKFFFKIVSLSKEKIKQNEILLILLSVVCGMTLLFLRGTFMVAFAYLVGILSAYTVALRIVGVKLKWKY